MRIVAILFAVIFVVLLFLVMNGQTYISPEAQALKNATDLNPSIPSDEEIFGTWTGKNEQLILSTDNHFSHQTPKRLETGTWKRDAFNLHLTGDDYSGGMRFIKFNKEYLLLTEPPDFSAIEGSEWLIPAIGSALHKEAQWKPAAQEKN
jgi:hypothetical protein